MINVSTSSVQTAAANAPARAVTILWRFVWKEFRMLRGLWLAVALLGFATQYAARLLLPPTSDLPTTLLAIAWSAAVLYAAGAAATMFSVEHEEETYGFLSTLPTTCWPMFAGKLLVTATSAVLLGVALWILGVMVRGRGGMSGADVSTVLGVLGIGILEAVAWGTLFSLIVRRPLVAAFLTLVIGLVAVNVIVNESSTYPTPSASPSAYVQVIPFRLAAVALLLACSALIARRWLAAGPGLRIGAGVDANGDEGFRDRFARSLGRLASLGRVADPSARPSMLARLLWQSWRESSKMLFLPLFVGVAALFVQVIFSRLIAWNREAPQFFLASLLLFVPALYGALAFHADQRRGNYQFLAEHAARPRYVWFARHAVWLGTLAAVISLILAVVAGVAIVGLGFSAGQFVSNYLVSGDPQYWNADSFVYTTAVGANDGLRFAWLAAGSCLLAYSIGQLCSMAIRSEILAAFVSLVLAFVVTAWMVALFAWRLPASLFLFPLFAGFMWATWLRAPAWIAGRKTVRSWLMPALAVAMPLLFVAAFLPAVRMTQLPLLAQDRHGFPVALNDNVPGTLHAFEIENTPEARKTADMYIKAAEDLSSARIDNPLAPWETDEFLLALAPGQTLESAIPADQLPAYRAAKKELERLRHELDVATLGPAIEASKRPMCRFNFDPRAIGTRPTDWSRSENLTNSYPLYGKLIDLMNNVSLRPLDLKKPFDGYLAALRMSDHLRSGQPSVIFIDQLERERHILDYIGNRAAAKEITKDQLRDVLEKLLAHFRDAPSPASTLLADHLLVRNVITGKDEPLILVEEPNHPVLLHDYLAYLANQLPWEQFRALQALNSVTLYNTNEVKQLVQYVNERDPRNWTSDRGLHRWFRPRSGFALPDAWTIEVDRATTSYLASLEYVRRVSVAELSRAYCDTEVCRRATLLRLALAMYRLDHKKYPTSLRDLVPEYLAELPLDPYGRQPFQYLPAGLELPLEHWSAMSNFGRIDPHTPFFWSVGIADVQPQQLLKEPAPTSDVSENELAGPEAGAAAPGEGGASTSANQPPEKLELVYIFVGNDESWQDANIFAFPLPK